MNEDLERATRSFRPCNNPNCKAECCNYARYVMARIEADNQALADVRTLDEWCKDNGHAPASVTWHPEDFGSSPRWCCMLGTLVPPPKLQTFYGATPDEVRAKAAAWIRETK